MKTGGFYTSGLQICITIKNEDDAKETIHVNFYTN